MIAAPDHLARRGMNPSVRPRERHADAETKAGLDIASPMLPVVPLGLRQRNKGTGLAAWHCIMGPYEQSSNKSSKQCEGGCIANGRANDGDFRIFRICAVPNPAASPLFNVDLHGLFVAMNESIRSKPNVAYIMLDMNPAENLLQGHKVVFRRYNERDYKALIWDPARQPTHLDTSNAFMFRHFLPSFGIVSH